MLKNVVGGVHETQKPLLVVLQPQRKAHHTESVARADHQHVFWSYGPHESVIDMPETQIEIIPAFVVSEGFGMIKYVENGFRIHAESMDILGSMAR